jgi:hypothetical protein
MPLRLSHDYSFGPADPGSGSGCNKVRTFKAKSTAQHSHAAQVRPGVFNHNQTNVLFQMFIEDIYIILLHGLHVHQLLFLGHLESVFNARLLLSWAYSIAKGMEYLASK